MTTKKSDKDPFADDVKPASEKTPEEAGVKEPVGGSALSPVIDEDGNPTNFPPVTNKDAAPWDPDIPAPGEPQVYGRGNIEAAKAQRDGSEENAYNGQGVPAYQENAQNRTTDEAEVASHLGGLHDADGNAVNPDGSPVGEGEDGSEPAQATQTSKR